VLFIRRVSFFVTIQSGRALQLHTQRD
jgi:hypothetical protein